MSNVAVRVEGLGKMYRIGGKQERYRTLRDSLTDAVSAPFKRARSLLHGQAYGAAGLDEEIWALKDVSFEVKHGEVVGIIGRNGAGKSTLLKILSRITEPTEGYADVYGRVGSLLEVGTGFHPELTGRENIYLNGAILGMSRQEIDRKFDEIVDFAEVERFIDTPVKHYSSGMGLRLGFAVAAHLEPEILVVDEVLAVGDAQFQKKCLGKMSDVAGEGRTVLFVSHNMAAVSQLCERGMLLTTGKTQAFGSIDDIVNEYLANTGYMGTQASLSERKDRRGSGVLHFTAISLVDKEGIPVDQVQAGQKAQFHIEYASTNDSALSRVSIAVRIDNSHGQYIFTMATQFTGNDFQLVPKRGAFVCHIPSVPLLKGEYRVHLWASVEDEVSDSISDCLQFNVIEGNVFGTGEFPISGKHGVVFVPHSWELAEATNA